MDRNSAIGLTLIAILLLLYFNFFAPEPLLETPPIVTTEQSGTDTTATVTPTDSLNAGNTGLNRASVEEKLTHVENNDLVITFSSHGGVPNQVELKKFKTYYQRPLLLVTPGTNRFTLGAVYEGKDIDLYGLHYEVQSRVVTGRNKETNEPADSTVVTYTTSLGDGKTIRQIYTIPSNGYVVTYRIEADGLGSSINGDQLTLQWIDQIPAQEKDIADSRLRTTVNYFSMKQAFGELSEGSLDLESETLSEPLKWVGIKQKFFTSAIIANGSFAGGEISMQTNPADTSVVKAAKVKLYISKSDLLGKKAVFKFFFGPNDYKVLTTVTGGFARNLYLGWPPVIWVNKFVIIPIFHFLEGFVSNYGVIIMIMVFIIRIILTPLSYSSYLGMAKMRLLKPELDLIKEKNGDNMTQTQQDQMKLYQQAGVNPFSGCIPLLLQMPILFAMFYFFPVSVELRQKSFLWADDLSTYDSVLNLPFTIPFYGDHVSLWVLLMTASTLVMTWQNNQISSVTGPMKSMGYVMPVIFMFVLNNFSAGLSFYYFVSNLMTFGQQAIIKRFVNEDKIKAVMNDHKKKMATGTGKKSKFMQKLEEAMKASEEARKKKN